MNFCSDNVATVSPAILEALAQANAVADAMPYGADEWTRRVQARVAEIFEHEVAVLPVATGTAANVIGLATYVPPYGAIYCHRLAHIAVDECGAPELYTGGAKLVPLEGADGRLDAVGLEAALAAAGAGVVHHVQPAAVSLTQASEAGTLYRPAEVAAVAELARRHGLAVHMDGARFANACAALDAAPADLTWRAGVDVLALGATKNGALAAEAVVFFDPAKAAEAGYRRKRGGHLFSKMRYLSAQLEAYLADDLWLVNAAHANAMARRLADGLEAASGARFRYPVEANEVFVELPAATVAALEGAGFRFYRMEEGDQVLLRLVTAFDTDPAHVDQFVAVARGRAAAERS